MWKTQHNTTELTPSGLKKKKMQCSPLHQDSAREKAVNAVLLNCFYVVLVFVLGNMLATETCTSTCLCIISCSCCLWWMCDVHIIPTFNRTFISAVFSLLKAMVKSCVPSGLTENETRWLTGGFSIVQSHSQSWTSMHNEWNQFCSSFRS